VRARAPSVHAGPMPNASRLSRILLRIRCHAPLIDAPSVAPRITGCLRSLGYTIVLVATSGGAISTFVWQWVYIDKFTCGSVLSENCTKNINYVIRFAQANYLYNNKSQQREDYYFLSFFYLIISIGNFFSLGFPFWNVVSCKLKGYMYIHIHKNPCVQWDIVIHIFLVVNNDYVIYRKSFDRRI